MDSLRSCQVITVTYIVGGGKTTNRETEESVKQMPNYCNSHKNSWAYLNRVFWGDLHTREAGLWWLTYTRHHTEVKLWDKLTSHTPRASFLWGEMRDEVEWDWNSWREGGACNLGNYKHLTNMKPITRVNQSFWHFSQSRKPAGCLSD